MVKAILPETKPRRHGGPLPVGIDLRTWAKDVLGKRGFSNVDLIAHWKDVIGEKLSDGVVPDKISYPKGERINGTLHVRVQGGAFATLLEHQKNIILDRVNTFLGYRALTDLRITQDTQIPVRVTQVPQKEKTLTPEQEALLQKRLDGIEDENLKKQLYEMGKKIFLK